MDNSTARRESIHWLSVTVVENATWFIEDMYSNKCLQDSLCRSGKASPCCRSHSLCTSLKVTSNVPMSHSLNLSLNVTGNIKSAFHTKPARLHRSNWAQPGSSATTTKWSGSWRQCKLQFQCLLRQLAWWTDHLVNTHTWTCRQRNLPSPSPRSLVSHIINIHTQNSDWKCLKMLNGINITLQHAYIINSQFSDLNISLTFQLNTLIWQLQM